jgi:hypothetical protein
MKAPQGCYILDKNHKPVPVDDMAVWGKWFENSDNRRVAHDEGEDAQGKWSLSSVCLGMDHRWSNDGPPILFETMLFRDNKQADDDGDQWRFATWDETERFHRRKVAELNGIKLIQGGAA